MNCKAHCVAGRLHISGELTIYTCEAVAEQVLCAITPGSAPLCVELDQVTEMDTAGLQVLLVARRHAHNLARGLIIASASPAVADVLSLCGLADLMTSATVASRS
jgi:anti-sigma B factor antagonist